MKIVNLPPEQWPELERILKDAKCGDALPKPQHGIMLGLYDEDVLIGALGAEKVWNISPMWIDVKYRGNGLPLMMVKALEPFNTEDLSEYCSTSSGHVEKLIYSLGFVPTLGQVWRRT